MTALTPAQAARPAWHDDALCAEVDPELWFPERGGDGGFTAKRVCRRCPVRIQCREQAMRLGPDLAGIWGGLSVRDRRRLHRKRGVA